MNVTKCKKLFKSNYKLFENELLLKKMQINKEV